MASLSTGSANEIVSWDNKEKKKEIHRDIQSYVTFEIEDFTPLRRICSDFSSDSQI